jgi:nicotinamidase/pyrazinamidase
VDYAADSALIVVDVQNDFADAGGSLSVRHAAAIVPILNAEIARARSAGVSIVYTQDWHPPTTPHFAKDGGVWPVHCLAASWGAAFHPDLIVDGEVVRKGVGGEDGYSGFSVADPRSGERQDTALDSVLRDHGIRRVTIGGLATDYCVRATALDAVERGFETTVLVDAIAGVDLAAGDSERALDEMRAAGVTLARAG